MDRNPDFAAGGLHGAAKARVTPPGRPPEAVYARGVLPSVTLSGRDFTRSEAGRDPRTPTAARPPAPLLGFFRAEKSINYAADAGDAASAGTSQLRLTDCST
ncbi:hypothetical protein NDU88_000222 [Pleurodeles waltl]|uniref:Uncharacterized protein n=1 Tax=Pleurodeles waltl TaxID=8319 RepID=A0AAV7MGA2_PLEWA|nr:hypothetical protein NDU88_000222 [Pleurodeles waltl]